MDQVLGQKECASDDLESLYKWLEFNRITLDEVHCILAKRPKAVSTVNKSIFEFGSPRLGIINPDDAWHYVSKALSHFFPSQKIIIESVEKNTITCFFSKLPRQQQAKTIDEGKPNYPKVFCTYSGQPGELITMAHEFSHALHIMSTVEEDTPPISREICAFIGELALLEYSKQTDLCMHRALKEAWRFQNIYYLGTSSVHLKTALSQEKAPYNYTWNYPIARTIAIHLHRCKAPYILWSLFEDGSNSHLYINYLTRIEQSPPEVSIFPAIGETNDKLLFDRYSLIGIIIVLDIIYNSEICRGEIGSYASEIESDFSSSCLFIGFSKNRYPVGYCKYKIESSEMGTSYVKSLREVAPFGQQSQLQAAFKKRFQSIGKVEVLHEA